MNPISIKVTKTVELNRDRLFDFFIPIELPTIFRGYGLLPAAVKVSEQTGAWDIVGHARTVHLSDGSTVHEEVTTCDRPELFSYKLSKFTGIFGLLVANAVGVWKFNAITDRVTEVIWEYSFYAKGKLAYPIVKPMLELLFQRYMEQIVEDLFGLAQQDIL
jgi:hypothetical protein